MRNITKEDMDSKILLFDRYVPSAMAYRMAEGVDKDWVANLNSVFPKPDIGFFIDITPEESVRRNTDAKCNIKASAEHLAKVREAYISILKENNLFPINGMQPIETILKKLLIFWRTIELIKIKERRKNMTQSFNTIVEQIKKCDLCKEKFGFKPHPIFLGNEHSKIVQISQAPSATVHETLMPFTDMSGKKLKYDWYKITDDVFYNPDNFYIAALAHCYPGKDSKGTDRMPPKICYEKWIKEELKYIDNKIYILIGAKSAKTFFPNDNFNDLIFKNNYLNGKLALVLPHPSPLNIKWFKDHPTFLDSRIKEVRNIIKNTLE